MKEIDLVIELLKNEHLILPERPGINELVPALIEFGILKVVSHTELLDHIFWVFVVKRKLQIGTRVHDVNETVALYENVGGNISTYWKEQND